MDKIKFQDELLFFKNFRVNIGKNNSDKKLIIGITGSTAAGKSTVSRYLRKLNYKIFDADREIRNVYKQPEVIEQLRPDFSEALSEDGTLDRKAMSDIIFSDSEKMKKLGNILYPALDKIYYKFLEDNRDQKVLFIDVPLLFEMYWENRCKYVILISTDEEVRVERFKKRGSNMVDFERIKINQMPDEEKRKLAHYVVDNNSDMWHLYRNIDAIMHTVLAYEMNGPAPEPETPKA